jgi:hypothetical protein
MYLITLPYTKNTLIIRGCAWYASDMKYSCGQQGKAG